MISWTQPDYTTKIMFHFSILIHTKTVCSYILLVCLSLNCFQTLVNIWSLILSSMSMRWFTGADLCTLVFSKDTLDILYCSQNWALMVKWFKFHFSTVGRIERKLWKEQVTECTEMFLPIASGFANCKPLLQCNLQRK